MKIRIKSVPQQLDRNARKWKHGLGGNLYGGGGLVDWVKSLFSSEAKTEQQTPTYRNRPASQRILATPEGRVVTNVPKRLRHNTSPTREKSEQLENQMRARMVYDQTKYGGSDPKFDIPFIPEKAILINGTTTSTNMLDSLAKYAGIHNRNPQLSEFPIKKRNSYPKPRKITMDEMLGISSQETKNGAQIYINDKDLNDKTPYSKRDLGNANYFTAFGYVPADNLMRNHQYNNAGVNRNTPPILDAFQYYAQEDYNSNDPKHEKDVIDAGKRAWQNPEVKKWWELSGKYWYNNGKGPEK